MISDSLYTQLQSCTSATCFPLTEAATYWCTSLSLGREALPAPQHGTTPHLSPHAAGNAVSWQPSPLQKLVKAWE